MRQERRELRAGLSQACCRRLIYNFYAAGDMVKWEDRSHEGWIDGLSCLYKLSDRKILDMRNAKKREEYYKRTLWVTGYSIQIQSAAGAVMTPRPKNSLMVANRSRLFANALWNISCLSAESSCALLKARMLLFVGAHLGHSAS